MPGESLPAALKLYAEIVRRPHLPGDQLDDARMGAMHEVRAVQDEPTQQVILRLKRMQYGPRDGRPTCGTEPGLTAITMRDVNDFYARRYRPDGAMLAIAGNFDPEAIIDLAQELFGDWKGQLQEIPQDRGGQSGYEHIQLDSSQTHIGLSFDSIPLGDPDYYVMRAGVGILSDGMSSRLFDRVRGGYEKWTYTPYELVITVQGPQAPARLTVEIADVAAPPPPKTPPPAHPPPRADGHRQRHAVCAGRSRHLR
jgi:predicted Zn-dependent peptidase